MILSEQKQSVVLDRVVREVKEYLGDKLDRIILYGSYARGDYEEWSDVDIMVLAHVEREMTPKYRRGISKISSRIGLEDDVFVSFMINSSKDFEMYSEVSGFYKNVIRDGRLLYGFDGRYR